MGPRSELAERHRSRSSQEHSNEPTESLGWTGVTVTLVPSQLTALQGLSKSLNQIQLFARRKSAEDTNTRYSIR